MSDLNSKIADRSAVVGVIGLGYVGLPLVKIFNEAGYPVVGFDVDPRKVSQLKEGQSYIEHIPGSDVQALLDSGRFDATVDFARLAEADAIIICVPTPLTQNREPDLSYVEKTAEAISATLRPGQLISLESTTYPGTTEEVLLARFAASGMTVGEDFYLAYSPEREDPGNPRWGAKSIPKVVAGVTAECSRLAGALYGSAVDSVVPVSSPRAGELCKLLENIYRAVNIALVNELKMLCHRMDLDVHEVIDAAATKPFGFHAFYPGPGLGGHCIPIDPFYLTSKAREYDMSTRFIELAGEVNTGMPAYVIQRVMEALNEQGKALRGSDVLLLGLAYKKDVDDVRESPSLKLLELLEAKGAKIAYSDPHVPATHKMRHHDLKLESQELTPERLAAADCVLISTDHSAFDYEAIVEHAQLVVDTRNATKGIERGREKIFPA